MAKKFYVVWSGRTTGIFSEWETARASVDGFAGARFKSFPTHADAQSAFRSGAPRSTGPRGAGKPATIRAPLASDAATFDMQIYCDGACEPNPGNAGSGIVIYRGGVPTQLWYGLYNPNGTNNTAELNALYQALVFAEEAIADEERVQILSDSKYAISCITLWAAGWEKKGWKKTGGEIKNLEIIQLAYALYLTIQDDVTVTHVSAHVGTEGNELADRMAMFAVLHKATELQQYSDAIDIPTILRMRAG